MVDSTVASLAALVAAPFPLPAIGLPAISGGPLDGPPLFAAALVIVAPVAGRPALAFVIVSHCAPPLLCC